MLNGVIDLGDLEPIRVHYRIGGADYELREASAAVAAKWRNATIRGARLADGDVVSLGEGVGESELVLVQQCLYKDGQQVSDKDVRAMRASVQKILFDKAVEISGLRDDMSEAGILKQIDRLQRRLAKVQAKNQREQPPSDTTST